MIILHDRSLPNTIEVEGKLLFLKTDYRLWVKFLIDIDNSKEVPDIRYLFEELPKEYDSMLSERKIPKNLFDELIKFVQADSIYPLSKSNTNKEIIPTTDYLQDGPFIYASFMKVYGIDLLDVDMHWYKFKALLTGLTLDYSTIIQCRIYDGKDVKLKEEREKWSINRAKINNVNNDDEIRKVYEYLYKMNQKSIKKGGE